MTWSRARLDERFRSSVQPVELARKLAKEMDDHRTISIHRVYVPNAYTVHLNPGIASSSPPTSSR